MTRAVGLLLAAATAPLLGWAIDAAPPHEDVVLFLPADQVVLHDASARAFAVRVEPGVDDRRLRARLDGRPVPTGLRGRTLTVSPGELSPGAHLLRIGVAYRGGVDREATVPVVVGPFTEGEDWMERAIELRIAPDDLGGERASLASAVSAIARRRAPPDARLGALRALPLRMSGVAGTQVLSLTGSAEFERGTVRFTVPLRLDRTSAHRIALTRGGEVAVELDEELRRLAAQEGARGGERAGRGFSSWVRGVAGDTAGDIAADVAAFAGSVVGVVAGESAAQVQASSVIAESIDHLLPDLSDALVLPETVPLGDGMPGISISLRFGEDPRFAEDGSLVLVIDARLSGAPPGVLPGPVRFEGAAAASPAGAGSRARFSGALVSALLDAHARSGALSLEIDRGIAGHRFGPLQIERTELGLPLVAAPGPPGRIRWALPDVRLRTSLPRDVRLFAAGAFEPFLSPDRRAVIGRIVVDDVGVSCRRSVPGGIEARPCLSDATSVLPDLPARLSAAIPRIRLFERALAELRDLRLDERSELRLSLRPRALTVAGGSQGPGIAIDFDVDFLAGR